MQHLIFFNTKGGSGKSTLCEYSAMELQRLGHNVSVENTDQQQHVTLIQNDAADFCLYDTAGAFTHENVKLLRAARDANSLIIVPMNTGKNDLKELPFLVSKLVEYQVREKTRFVFTKTRTKGRILESRRETLVAAGLGLLTLIWVMPVLDDFAEMRQSARTRNVISTFLKEVLK
ncbi:ParA family protein [Candidatus Enterovibrio escicola]|uniref:ParA family protein n=1 Tax=Candidatus Enterovibrio escicola TaxID=1927127 RepID=UPI001237DD27|nr:ParA family protein [Candidatus Enterovibrio escacola]